MEDTEKTNVVEDTKKTDGVEETWCEVVEDTEAMDVKGSGDMDVNIFESQT